MRLRFGAKTVAGGLAVVGMLALSSPGVRVALAGDGELVPSDLPVVGVSSDDEAGVCRVGEEPKPRLDRAAVSARIAQRLRMEMQLSDEKPVVLNGRGYNYGTTRDPLREIAIVEAEAKRQREQAPGSR